MKKVILLIYCLLPAWLFGQSGSFRASDKNPYVNPFIAHKEALQGTYLADVRAMAGGLDQIHQYGMYVIKGDDIINYSWDNKKKSWVKNFSAPYQLIYYNDNDYMTGYNIVYQSPYGYEVKMCTGDVNGDGKMDIWSSDSIFHTKQ